ncbi:hypothetical protein, partial [uncultured Neglectibacter sp.]|uniref:hypothetical protein n=1 Tax=uncultured Neglectibacter sp. TaxID=1924108 RepID=UPI0034DE0B41
LMAVYPRDYEKECSAFFVEHSFSAHCANLRIPKPIDRYTRKPLKKAVLPRKRKAAPFFLKFDFTKVKSNLSIKMCDRSFFPSIL